MLSLAGAPQAASGGEGEGRGRLVHFAPARNSPAAQRVPPLRPRQPQLSPTLHTKMHLQSARKPHTEGAAHKELLTKAETTPLPP